MAKSIRKHQLSSNLIDKLDLENEKGVYELYNSDGRVRYVGRSEVNLAERLKQHASDGRYKDFRYMITDTVKHAFEVECNWYHDHEDNGRKLANKEHPKRPKDKNFKCPKETCGTNHH